MKPNLKLRFIKIYNDENGEYCRLTVDEVKEFINNIDEAYHQGFEDGRKVSDEYWKSRQINIKEDGNGTKPDWYKDNWWTNPTVTCDSDSDIKVSLL